MRDVMSLPLWAVALVLAAIAPMVAKGLASMFERRSHERGRRILGQREVKDEAKT